MVFSSYGTAVKQNGVLIGRRLFMYNGSITSMVCFGTMLVVALYDMSVLIFFKKQSFVSQWIADTSGLTPFQLVMSGILIDHFFGWTMKRKIVNCPDCKTIFDVSTNKKIN